MLAFVPLSGGAAAALRAAHASDGLLPRIVSPNAAAALRRSIDAPAELRLLELREELFFVSFVVLHP